MSEKSYVDMPALSTECLDLLLQEVADKPDQPLFVIYSNTTKTLATVDIENGKIIQWSLEGPMEPAEAQQIVARTIDDVCRRTFAMMQQAQAEKDQSGPAH